MELALLVPLIIVLLALIVEVALVARIQVEIVGAAREGARVAATTPDPARALAAAREALGRRGPDARISIHRPYVVGEQATVSIELQHHLSLPLLGGLSIPLSGGAVMRVER